MPEDKAQENFTDPDSRIMKRAGGGFDPAYNAQTAVDEAAHIIVAAELDNVAPDANWLLPMIQSVKDNLGELPALGLADAGYRSEDNLKNAPIELVVALGREGKEHAEIDAEQYPHTAAMAAKLQTDGGQAADRGRQSGVPQAQVDRRAAQRLDQERAGVPTVQPAGAAPGAGRVEARVHGAEPAAHGNDGWLKGNRCAKNAPAICPQQPHQARQRLQPIESAAQSPAKLKPMGSQRTAVTCGKFCRADS